MLNQSEVFGPNGVIFRYLAGVGVIFVIGPFPSS
jgi:hypothetical protein